MAPKVETLLGRPLFASLGRIQVEHPDLVETRDSEEAVAAHEAVVQEAEGTLTAQRHKPQAELRHLDRHLVDITTVETVLDHLAAGINHDGVGVSVHRHLASLLKSF